MHKQKNHQFQVTPAALPCEPDRPEQKTRHHHPKTNPLEDRATQGCAPSANGAKNRGNDAGFFVSRGKDLPRVH